MFLLVLLLPLSHSIEDCLGGEWGNWSRCGETQVPLLTSQRVGERLRERVRLGGEHCLRSDLIEVRLCRLGVIEPEDTFEDTAGEDLMDDSDRHETEGTNTGNTTMVTSEKPTNQASNLRADNQASTNNVTESAKADPLELSNLGTNHEVLNLLGRIPEPALAASSHHVTHHVTERSTLITLLAICVGMLGSGAVVGLVLVRKHRQLQFRHHVLVRTRERVRLIDSPDTGSTGNTPSQSRPAAVSWICGSTHFNPGYSSDWEDEGEVEPVEAEQFSLEIES